ncbi:hypothetical protein BGX21_004576 [Mortierella sp. AD011]|nr:hypothetical protein BGX20_009272 [Mortierella sp. AD010]KAF9373086.1 hypothetical protein BGX21_004576 [Mortierella sp. AD011]
MPVINNVISFANGLIPRAHTSDGLRQLQLMTVGLFGIYMILHFSLYMDKIAYHVFFITEIGSIIVYLFLPVKYEVRPVSLLKRRFYLLVALATFWLIQPSLLLLDDGPEAGPLPSLFDSREVVTAHISKTLNQIQIEAIIKQGGKVEDKFQGQHVYANSLAAALQCEAWLAVLCAGFILVEAAFVWNKASYIERTEGSSRKTAATATTTTSSSSSSSTANAGAEATGVSTSETKKEK